MDRERKKDRKSERQRKRERGRECTLNSRVARARGRVLDTPNATCCRVETPGATEVKESAGEPVRGLLPLREIGRKWGRCGGSQGQRKTPGGRGEAARRGHPSDILASTLPSLFLSLLHPKRPLSFSHLSSLFASSLLVVSPHPSIPIYCFHISNFIISAD